MRTGRDFWFPEVNLWTTAKAITSKETYDLPQEKRSISFPPEVGRGAICDNFVQDANDCLQV